MTTKNRTNTRHSSSCFTAKLPVRGVYVKIARKLGVHPSYVSRVARGERRSVIVEDALHKEFTSLAGQMAGVLTAYFGQCPPNNWLALINIQVAVGMGSTRTDAFEQARENGYSNAKLIRTTSVDGTV